MKETKKFFENNRLNRGYARIANPQKSDITIMRERYKHILPPLDLIAEYEDLRPGTFNRLLNMVETEQRHRHAADILVVEKNEKANKLGRLCSLVFVFLICITMLILSLQGGVISVISFAILALLAVITLVSFLSAKVSAFKLFERDKAIKNQAFGRSKNRNYRR